MFKWILWQEGIQCLRLSLEEEISDEDDAEKIDLLQIVGKEPGQDLVVTSWASGRQSVRNMEIQLTAAAWSDILNHSEIILPAFLPNISSARSVAIFSPFPSSYPEIVFPRDLAFFLLPLLQWAEQ